MTRTRTTKPERQQPRTRKTVVRDPGSDSARDEASIQSAAHVAAQLLPWCADVNEAVWLAYGIFDVCREQGEHRSIVKLVQTAFEPSNMVPFRKAISTITGRKDPDYASKIYAEFCREVALPLWEKMNAPTPGSASPITRAGKTKIVRKFVAAQRAKGIPKMQVAFFQPLFALTKPMRRKTPKSKRRWRSLALNASGET